MKDKRLENIVSNATKKDAVLSIRISQQMLTNLREYCKEKNLVQGDIIIQLLTDFLSKK